MIAMTLSIRSKLRRCKDFYKYTECQFCVFGSWKRARAEDSASALAALSGCGSRDEIIGRPNSSQRGRPADGF